MIHPHPPRRGFSLVEWLVVLVAVTALVVVALPVFSKRQDHGPRCPSHLKQLGIALQMYLQDYDNRFPPAAYVSGTQSYTLPGLLDPYIKNGSVWTCPQTHPEQDAEARYDQTPADTTVDFGYNAAALNRNGKGIPAGQIADEAGTVVFAESSSYRAAPGTLTPALGGTSPSYRHGEQANVGWADGHVKAMRREVLEMTRETESGRQLGSGIDGYPYWNLR